ncbi:hypothetical protein [Alteromonas sp. H39]|uniref:hypothetical protein n=1 Tax=Alteromonas sp. H39 TaxID=3389876 RepID=UPI0039E016CF
MRDNDLIQKLVMFCHQIANEGGTPSIALLRAKAPFKVSVTQAIDAVKAYQASNKKTSADTSNKDETITRLEKRVAALEGAVATLEKRLSDWQKE